MTDLQLIEILSRNITSDNILTDDTELILPAMREAVQKGIEDAFIKYIKDKHSPAFKKFKEEFKRKELDDVREYNKKHGMITWVSVEDEHIYLDYLKSLTK